MTNADRTESMEILPYGLPPEAYVQPVYSADDAEAELERAYEAGGISKKDLDRAKARIDEARSGSEIVDVVNQEHLLGPASPDPDRYHRENCDCGRHGKVALGSTVEVTPAS